MNPPNSSATEDSHRTIAPLLGPDDERIFTDSGPKAQRNMPATWWCGGPVTIRVQLERSGI